MGQYYSPYLAYSHEEIVFDNKIGKVWNGLKLMEHSYVGNRLVGQVYNELNKFLYNVYWEGDYADEEDYAQVNCSNYELKKHIYEFVWGETEHFIKGKRKDSLSLRKGILVNVSKQLFIIGNKYYNEHKWRETWNGKHYYMCVDPLPLLTCSASHSGGSYHGINDNLCGTWYGDLLWFDTSYTQKTINELIENGFQEWDYEFTERGE